MNDTLILELFRKRDEQAIAKLAKKYGKLCIYIARNILSQHEDAEECVNSAYFETWNHIPPDNPDNLQAYVCRIVRNISINRLEYNNAEKRNPQVTVSIDELSECIPDKSDPQEKLSAEEIGKLLSCFLREQDEKYRKVFVRRYWYGDSISAIAEFYGMKEKTVATYLFRTRKKLKIFLQKEGYEYE